jgi:hypothetical protein
MKHSTRTILASAMDRAIIAGLILLALLLFGMQTAHAVELLPSVGLAFKF